MGRTELGIRLQLCQKPLALFLQTRGGGGGGGKGNKGEGGERDRERGGRGVQFLIELTRHLAAKDTIVRCFSFVHCTGVRVGRDVPSIGRETTL